MQEVDELLDHAAAAVESIIAEGVEKSMTKFNRRAQGLNTRGRMRIYEELFIVKPDATEEEIDRFVDQIKRRDHQRRRHRRQRRQVGRAQAGLSRAEAQRRLLRADAVHSSDPQTGEGSRAPPARDRHA